MSYMRVVPRDLFNEANMLKCLGQLYLKTEYLNGQISIDNHSNHFELDQCPDTGELQLVNIDVTFNGDKLELFRPLNSREPYPLWLRYGDDEEMVVFNDDGSLSTEFAAFIDEHE